MNTQNFDYVLDIFSNIDPHCVIAGGAPRDIQLNRNYSDIDLFLFVPLHWTNTVFKQVVEKVTGLKIRNLAAKESAMYSLNPNIIAVYDTEVYNEKVQIVRYNKPTFGIHESFALSICQTAYKNGIFYSSKLFSKSIECKTIFQVDTLYADKNVYINKIKSKFPDYDFISLIKEQ